MPSLWSTGQLPTALQTELPAAWLVPQPHVLFASLVVCAAGTGLVARRHRDQASTKPGWIGVVQTRATSSAGPRAP
jgi:hypothetical protein